MMPSSTNVQPTPLSPDLSTTRNTAYIVDSPRWLRWLALMLLGAMLVPIWLTPYPMFGDYSNHLLQANVVLEYENPPFGYESGYELVPRWYLNSTALSTLLMVGLGAIMPIQIAGRVVLSLYMALFVGGWLLLLHNQLHSQLHNQLHGQRRVWPLLLLLPLLAYNLTFTTGFINFAYGITLGLFALYLYLQWQQTQRARDLWLLAILLLLTYLAHVLAWALWLLVIAAHAAAQAWPARRYGALWLAMNGALPLLLLTRPSLGAAGLLIGPSVWIGAWVLRRLKLAWGVQVAALVGLLVIGYQIRLIVRLPEALQNLVFPAPIYNRLAKQVMPLKLFSIPHQFAPPDDLLTWLNGGMVLLVILLFGLLCVRAWQARRHLTVAWLYVIALLLLVYFWFPTNTYDIVTIEPRILLVLALVVVLAVPLPHKGSRLWQVMVMNVVTLCLLSVGTLFYSTYMHAQRVESWRAQWATLEPARSILVIYDNNQDTRNYPNALSFFTSVYDGRHFANLYAVEHGGFVSVTFNNGPIRLNPTYSLPGFWRGFEMAAYVTEECTTLQAQYDAIVVLRGAQTPELADALSLCLHKNHHLPDMAVWLP